MIKNQSTSQPVNWLTNQPISPPNEQYPTRSIQQLSNAQHPTAQPSYLCAQMTYELRTTAVKEQPRYVTTLHLMVAFILFGISLGCGMLYWFTTVSPKFKLPFLPLLVLAAACFATSIFILIMAFKGRQWLQHGRNNNRLRWVEFLLLIAGSAAFLNYGWRAPSVLFAILAAVIVFAIFWEKKGAIDNAVTLDDTGVHLPARLSGHRPWHDVDKVLLRHGTLTIEFEENKIWQQNIQPPTFPPTELEAWAATQIDTHRPKRTKNW